MSRVALVAGHGLFLLLVAASYSAPHAALADEAAAKPLRWAIFSSAEVQESGLADLLTAELTGRPGIELVERDRLQDAMRELRLSNLLGAKATASRLKLGELVGADVLILLAVEKVPAAEQPEKQVLRLVVSECHFGVRLRSDWLAWNPNQGPLHADKLVAAVEQAQSRLTSGLQHIVAVSPMIDRSLQHTHAHLQHAFQHALEAALLQYDGVAVVELEEAHQLAIELDRAGRETADLPTMLFVEGEYRTAPHAEGAVRFDLKLVVRDASQPLWTASFEGQTESELAEQLTGPVPERLVEQDGRPKNRAIDRAAQAKLLNDRAAEFEELGDFRTSLGLREAALLLKPDNVKARVMAIHAWPYTREFFGKFTGFTAEERPIAAKELMDAWSHEARHIRALMSRRLVNLREANQLRDRVVKRYGFLSSIYSNRDIPLAPAESWMLREYIDGFYDFYREMALAGERLDPSVADGTDRFAHRWYAYAKPGRDSWDARAQRDAWLTGLVEGYLRLGVVGYSTNHTLHPAMKDRALADILWVLTELTGEESPPFIGMNRLVLAFAQCAGTPPDYFALFWDNSLLYKGERFRPAQWDRFATALRATGKPTNVFYADCLSVWSRTAATKVYEHDRKDFPEIQRLTELARERNYGAVELTRRVSEKPHDLLMRERGANVVLRLQDLEKAITEMADLSDKHRKKLARPPVAAPRKFFQPTPKSSRYDGRDPDPRVRFTPIPDGKADWVGLIACGDKLDAMWSNDEVFVMPAPGRVESIFQLPASKAPRAQVLRRDAELGIEAVQFDGENLWIATTKDGVHVVSPQGERLGHLPYGDVLPVPSMHTFDKTLVHLHAIEPGRALFAGNHGPNFRLFVAFLERNAEGEFHARIIHTGMKLAVNRDEAPKHDEIDRAFTIKWGLPYTDPRSGRKLVLLGRPIYPEMHGVPWPAEPRPLAVDLETGEVERFRADLRKLRKAHFPRSFPFGLNAYAAAGKIYFMSERDISVYQPELENGTRDFRSKELLRTWGGTKFGALHRFQLVRQGDFLYVPDFIWGRIDLTTDKFELLSRAPLPMQYRFGRYANSAHYGLVAWNAQSGELKAPSVPNQMSNEFKRRHLGTLFQVKIDEPVEAAAEVEHVPEPERPRHIKALTALRKLGAYIGIDDTKSNLGALVVLTDKWKGDDQDLLLINDLYHPDTLKVFGAGFDNESLRRVGQFSTLTRLELYHTHCNDDGLPHLAGLTNLRFLALGQPKEGAVTARGLAHFQSAPIKTLIIAGEGLDDAAAVLLENFRSLRSLDLLSEHHISAAAFEKMHEKPSPLLHWQYQNAR